MTKAELTNEITESFLFGGCMYERLKKFCEENHISFKLNTRFVDSFEFYDGKVPMVYSIPVAINQMLDKRRCDEGRCQYLNVYWVCLLTYFEFVDILIKQYNLEV